MTAPLMMRRDAPVMITVHHRAAGGESHTGCPCALRAAAAIPPYEEER